MIYDVYEMINDVIYDTRISHIFYIFMILEFHIYAHFGHKNVSSHPSLHQHHHGHHCLQPKMFVPPSMQKCLFHASM